LAKLQQNQGRNAGAEFGYCISFAHLGQAHPDCLTATVRTFGERNQMTKLEIGSTRRRSSTDLPNLLDDWFGSFLTSLIQSLSGYMNVFVEVDVRWEWMNPALNSRA